VGTFLATVEYYQETITDKCQHENNIGLRRYSKDKAEYKDNIWYMIQHTKIECPM